jgi:hypothetical protein
MNKKQKIKIIKKSDPEITQTPPIEDEKRPEKNTSRKISSTVSEWIKEFQQRRYEESMLTFDQLLANNSQVT